MKNTAIAFLFAGLLTACNTVENAKRDMAASATETMLEKTTGFQVDAPETENAGKGTVDVALTLDGKSIAATYTGGIGAITITPGTIAVSVAKEESETQHSVSVGFVQPEVEAMRPVQGRVKSENTSEAPLTITIGTIGANEMSVLNAMEGTAVVESMTDRKAVIRVSAKMAAPQDSADPAKWQTLEGQIVMDYPMISTMGISKEAVTY